MENSKNPVLVVDDDADIRMVLTDVLEAEGFHPFEAENGLQALETLEQIPRPCLVLLDLMMPVMDGHEFLRRVRARPELCPEVHVVVCTASNTLPSQEPPVEAILRKPFELGDLMDLLAQQRRS
jgi:CheY-like chemotaxis protein